MSSNWVQTEKMKEGLFHSLAAVESLKALLIWLTLI
jgi:hypothetical protein